MTTISAELIADSIYYGARITTVMLRYPRFIHAELMTHRVFSRNASSSRAIPVAKLIQDVMDYTAIPLHWGKNQKGMQADTECDEPVGGVSRVNAWLDARDNAIRTAKAFNEAGYHKQVVNRLLEPFAHINVLVTATDWDNFFQLRDHDAAEPHIRMLARCIRDQMDFSDPTHTKNHLPFVSADLLEVVGKDNYDVLSRYSAASCARVSYLTRDQKVPTLDENLALSKRLLDEKHMSPFEHQAVADKSQHRFANFVGWRSYRYGLENNFD